MLSSKFFIEGNLIQFVDEWSHLGHVISFTNDDRADFRCEKVALYDYVNNVLNFFRNRDPIINCLL